MRSSFFVIFIAGWCTLSPTANAAVTETLPSLHALADIAVLSRLPQVNEADPGSRIWVSRVSDLVRDRMQIMDEFKARNRCKLTKKMLEPLNAEFVQRGLPKMSPLALQHYNTKQRVTPLDRQYTEEEADRRDVAIRRIVRENPNADSTELNNLVTDEIRRLGLPAVSASFRTKLVKRAQPPGERYPRRYTDGQMAIRHDVIVKAMKERPDLSGKALAPLVAEEIAKLGLPTMQPYYIAILINRVRKSHSRPRPGSRPFTTTVAPSVVSDVADTSVGSDGAIDEESECTSADDTVESLQDVDGVFASAAADYTSEDSEIIVD